MKRYRNYFYGCAAGGVCCCGAGNVGAGVVGAGCVVVGLRFGSLPVPVPGEMNTGEIIVSTAINTAIIHVPFSSTSVVCLTPINCVLKPAMFPASPPPFGFCTR